MDEQEMQKLINFSKTLKVLVVEDNKITRDQIVKLLNHLFDNITLSSDGVDGLEKFKTNNFDLIISDINMPKMNGLIMSEEIKSINQDIPIILISGENEVEYFMHSIKIGIDGFLLKPLSLEQFLSILSKIIKNIQNIIEIKKNIKIKQQLEKQEALSEMLNNITHHWRQPLSLISAAAGSIELTNEHEIATKEKNIESSVQIIKAAEFLSKMIEDFRKLFNDTHENSKEYINFREIVKNMINNLDNILLVQNIEDISIIGNKNLIENILIPIFNNALEIQNKKSKKIIFLDIVKVQDIIHITIKDNGGGIDENIINKIFDPYFSKKHRSFGVGLSLYFVYYIVVKYLNGTITVFNESYKYKDKEYTGARFDIKIKY
jgi:YesN/AraC family two-component response regulator